MSIQQVRARIGRVRLAAAALAAAMAFARWFVEACGVAVLVFLADWRLVYRLADSDTADRHGRLGLLAAAGVALAVGFVRLLPALRRALRDEDDVALRIERAHPELRHRLVSALQFSRAGARPAGSPELMQATLDRAVEQCGTFRFRHILDWRTPLRSAGLALAVAAALAAACAWRPDLASAFARRMAFRVGDYPTATRLLAIEAPDKAARGEPLTVAAVVDTAGVVPDEGRLQVRGRESGARGVRTLAAQAGRPGRFAVQLDTLMESIEFRVLVHDARSAWRRVTVLPRPAVTAVELEYIYPEYTGLSPRKAEGADVQAVVGTRIRLTARASKPIREATLARRLAAGEERVEPLRLGADSRTLHGEFVVDASGTYRIRVRDTDDLADAAPSQWLIEALPDRAPTVMLLFPGEDKTVTPKARWPLQLTVEDDFGLGSATLVYEMTDPTVGTPAQEGRKPLGLVSTNGPARRLSMRSLVDMAAFGARPGHQIHYYVEVTDNHPGAPNRGRSRSFTFAVSDEKTVREALNAARDGAIRQLGVTVQEQEASRAQVDVARRALRQEPAP